MKKNGYGKGFGWILTILLFGIVAAVQAAPGDLDATFAGTGKTRLGFGSGKDYGRAVAVQADGKLVVAGYGGYITGTSSGDEYYSVAIVRYNTDNTLDASFGIGGKVNMLFELGNARVEAMKIQADGKIVVAGSLINGLTRDFLVVRYNTDGSLDTSFDADGMAIVDVGTNETGRAMIIDANGKIIVVGFIGGSNSALIRLTSTGALDTTFGGGGKVFLPANIFGGAVTLQADGKIIVAGDFYDSSSGNYQSAKLVRYHSTGALDASFGSGGTVNSPVANTPLQVNAVAMQFGDQTSANPDKILVAGGINPGDSSSSQMLVARYNLNGTLDTSFDADGLVFTDIGEDNIAQDIIVQRSGFTTRIFVAGYTGTNNGASYNFAVLRYNPNGSLNTGFDGDGIVTTSIGASSFAAAMTMRGENLVVAGTAVIASNNDFAVARYNFVTGALDTTFDGDGIKTQDVTDERSSVSSAAVQTDGKIVVAGYAVIGNHFTGNTVFALARYNADGTLDASFGTNGKATTNINGYSGCTAMAIQADGKIVVAGYAATGNGDNGFAVARYNTNGTLDISFGTSGFVVTAVGASASALAIQSDGKIVVAGTSSSDNFVVLRYLASGALDSSFDADGVAFTDIAGDDFVAAVKIQSDGKIVVAGSSGTTSGSYNVSIARYLTNGALDTSFGNLGKVVTDIGGGNDGSYGMAIQPDGKIVVTGYSVTNSYNDLLVVRYLAGGALDASFGSNGKVTTSIGTGSDIGRALTIEASGKIVVAGHTQLSDSNSAFATVRYHPTGALDTGYGIGGKAVADVTFGIDRAYTLALDSAGRAVIAGKAKELFAIVRLLGDASLAPTYEADVFPRGNGDGAVSSTDVSIVQGFQLGVGLPYQSNEFQRADCAPLSNSPFARGDGRVSSIDVSQAQAYQLGLNLAANNTFQPAAGPTAPGSNLLDFNGWIGNDESSQANSLSGVPAPRRVRIVSQTIAINASSPHTVTVPINVDAAGDESVYGFGMSYDTSVFSDPVVTIGTAGGSVMVNTTQAGKIGFSINGFAGNRLAAGDDRNLVNVTFTILKRAGTHSIAFTDDPTQREVASALPNVRVLPTTFEAGGTVTITETTAAVSVSGRVLTAKGSGLINATVTLTDQNGAIQSVITAASGRYIFENVRAGETYIIDVSSKRYRFSPQIVNVIGQLEDLDFTATEQRRRKI